LKRVVYFSDAPYFGGAEKYLLLLATGIGKHGYQPHFVLSNPDKILPLVNGLIKAGIDYRSVSLNLPFSASDVWKFVKLVKEIKPDIFHINLPGPWSSQYSLVAPIAKFSGASKVVSTEHLPMIEPFFKGKIIKRFSSTWVDRVITVSNDNVEHLIKKHGIARGKIRVIHLGIPDIPENLSVDRGEYRLKKDDFVIAIIGSLEKRKGHSLAFEVVSQLPEFCHLMVAGTGPMEKELMKLSNELRISGRVHFLGYVENVFRLLSISDALILTSSLEATPYVLIEALATGIPSVASDIFGIKEIVTDGKTGFLVTPEDVKGFVKAINRLIQEPELRKRMGMNARQDYLKRFTVERFISETISVYDELV